MLDSIFFLIWFLSFKNSSTYLCVFLPTNLDYLHKACLERSCSISRSKGNRVVLVSSYIIATASRFKVDSDILILRI